MVMKFTNVSDGSGESAVQKVDVSAFTAGEIRVYAVLQDVSDIGEMEADEVGRDQLA